MGGHTLTLRVVLLVLALFCFALAAFGVSSPRVDLQPLGLALLTGAFLV